MANHYDTNNGVAKSLLTESNGDWDKVFTQYLFQS